MPYRSLVILVAAGLLLSACEEGDGGRGAWTLEVLPSRVTGATVETMESAPPGFAVTVTVDLPHPGYAVKVDSTSGPDENGRITAKITTTSKPGAWPQVVTPASVRVPLGGLEEGQYLLEVLERRGGDAAHRPVGAVLLRARGR